MNVKTQQFTQHKTDERQTQESHNDQDKIVDEPIVIKKVSLSLENTSIDGMCSCVCISDCSCDSWL